MTDQTVAEVISTNQKRFQSIDLTSVANTIPAATDTYQLYSSVIHSKPHYHRRCHSHRRHSKIECSITHRIVKQAVFQSGPMVFAFGPTTLATEVNN